jgi:hypothetical protein
MRLPVEGRVPSKEQLRGCAPYGAAAALYIVIGVVCTDFMLSVFAAVGYLFVVVWLVPVVLRRIR